MPSVPCKKWRRSTSAPCPMPCSTQDEDFAVRRRIPRVMAVCTSQRAADSLVLGLADIRFEVRFQCGRALAAIVAKHPRRPHWRGRHLRCGSERGRGRPPGLGRAPFARSTRGQRARDLCRRLHQESRQPESGPRVHHAVAGAAARAAPDRPSRTPRRG